MQRSHRAPVEDAERREYFRVSTHLPVRAQVLDARACARLASEILAHAGPGGGGESHLEPDLVEWLDRLEAKLDRVLAHLGLGDGPRFEEADVQEVMLSGSGMGFRTPFPCPTGSDVCLMFELPGRPRRLVRSLAHVVNSEPEADEGGPCRVAVTFRVIHEDDRDAIVAHALDVQRAQRRALAEDA